MLHIVFIYMIIFNKLKLYIVNYYYGGRDDSCYQNSKPNLGLSNEMVFVTLLHAQDCLSPKY